MEIIQKCERYFTPIGRIVIGAYFVLSGVDKLMNIPGTAGAIESVGLPAGVLLGVFAAILEVGAGGALVAGYYTKYAALALAAFVLVVSFLFHSPGVWTDNPIQQILFMKNMAIAGGLLFMAAHVGAPCCQTKLGVTSESGTGV